ncbi:YycH family regulatory protein [Paraliobacillus sp. X-1268]|uniref:YycH family regulatory protein n=1 Tax=Paraliobacillus sp. X-1268 TaxID=2213193 RepID=UPI000E3E7399|nr:two-component system activity regulator YycH [Paraliobacillus sp. X-1268]
MNLESIKSFILIFLIAASLLLTLATWNYQPNIDEDEGDTEDSVIEAQLDGEQLTKKDVVRPSQIIYKLQGQAVGLADKNNENDLYNQILNLSLYDFEVMSNPMNQLENNQNQVEIIFPVELPTDVIVDLFSIDNEVNIPDSTFDRVYITLSSNQEDNQIVFVKTSTGTAISAKFQNSDQTIESLIDYENDNESIRYEVLENANELAIYLPSEISLSIEYFSYKTLDSEPFRNLLFNTPSSVRNYKNISREIYTDGISEMTVEDGYSINFSNPINDTQVLEESVTQYQLFDQVHQFINKHNGFTSTEPFQFFLSELLTSANTNLVEYNLAYQGYPIYEMGSLATISINWHNQDPSIYSHPIVQLVDRLETGQVPTTFLDTTSVLEILNGNTYSDKTIYDVAVGYQIEKEQGDQTYKIIPTWYVEGISGWEELEIPGELLGGDNSAMGTN